MNRETTEAKTDETKTNVTKLEMQFMKDLACSDFSFECCRGGYETDDDMMYDGIRGYVCSTEGFNMKVIRGVMSSLEQKGIISIDSGQEEYYCGHSVESVAWVSVKSVSVTKRIYEDFKAKGWC